MGFICFTSELHLPNTLAKWEENKVLASISHLCEIEFYRSRDSVNGANIHPFKHLRTFVILFVCGKRREEMVGTERARYTEGNEVIILLLSTVRKLFLT